MNYPAQIFVAFCIALFANGCSNDEILQNSNIIIMTNSQKYDIDKKMNIKLGGDIASDGSESDSIDINRDKKTDLLIRCKRNSSQSGTKGWSISISGKNGTSIAIFGKTDTICIYIDSAALRKMTVNYNPQITYPSGAKISYLYNYYPIIFNEMDQIGESLYYNSGEFIIASKDQSNYFLDYNVYKSKNNVFLGSLPNQQRRCIGFKTKGTDADWYGWIEVERDSQALTVFRYAAQKVK